MLISIVQADPPRKAETKMIHTRLPPPIGGYAETPHLRQKKRSALAYFLDIEGVTTRTARDSIMHDEQALIRGVQGKPGTRNR